MSQDSPMSPSSAYVRTWLATARATLDAVDLTAVDAALGLLEQARVRRSTVWICGNGGSAATASHFANDLLAIAEAPRLRVVCLCDNLAVVTARANDDGYAEVFARQLDGRIEDGDLLIALSVSGRSPNILRAMDVADAAGVDVLALCGFAGSPMEARATVAVRVPAPAGAYGPVEGVHSLLCHLLANRLAGVHP